MTERTENKGFIYEFGRFVLDPQERVLLADGKPVHLADKVFDTLLFLIKNNGRLLTKEEMMTSIWEESFVEESNLAKNISRLRKILNADGASLIETLPKHGYRFLADVKQIDAHTNLLVHRRLRVKITQTLDNGDDDTKTPTAAASLDEVHSIAVLPFQPLNLKSEDDFFGVGITDALITQLSRSGSVPVRPTSSILKYNVPEQSAVSAGRELQVDAILEGKFQRLDNKLRLTVQMLQTANGASLWADSFNAEIEDIFAVQDQIAARVVGALTKKLSGEAQTQLVKRDTENVEAYQLYLKGRFYWNKRTIENYDRALACYQAAIEVDPLYALAYAGLADIYNLLPMYDGFAPNDYFPKAKAAALKALALDKNLAEAHAALGQAILYCDWNFSGAEISYRQAIKLNPNFPAAYQLLGSYLCRVERISEAVIVLKKAQELDPLAPINAVWLAEVLRYCGETEASIKLHLETLKTSPDFFPAHYHLAHSYLDAGQLTEAEAHGTKAVALANGNSLTLSLQGIVQAARGNSAEVKKTLNKLLARKAEKYISAANIAIVYAASGAEDEALKWLETAFDERDPYLTWLKFDKEFHNLRQNERFQNLLEKIGLSDVEVKRLPVAPQASSWKSPLLALGILSISLIAAAAGFYFWKREKAVPVVNRNEIEAVRLTDNPNHDSHPHWTPDGRIRFYRIDANRQTESLIMNADGTNQSIVKNFDAMQYGFFSPDEQKVIFAKPNDKQAYYLANADGTNEIALPFFAGNFDWSFDAKFIVYQKNIDSNAEIFVYSVETGESRNLTNSPSFDADPSFSPDAKHIVFVSSRDGNGEIYVMNASDGSDVRRLTDNPAVDSHPVFSPDGTQIAFSSDREKENSDIYLIRADGSGGQAVNLTNWDKTDESILPGGWSPDGTRIVFTSNRNGKDDIYVVSAEVFRPQPLLSEAGNNLSFPSYSPDGRQFVYQVEKADKSGEMRVFDSETKQTRLLSKNDTADISPAWSPTGEWIAFQKRIDGNTEIFVIKPDGSSLKNLTNNPSRDITPAWSPDGSRIVFASNRDGGTQIFQIYTMNAADGGDQRRIYYSEAFSSFPAWSPDGRQIVFANDKEDGRSGNFEIFVIEPETVEAAKRLTFRRRFDTQPNFSPDGKRIAFVSETDGNSEIYLMNADGTGILRLTRNASADASPHWSPDGKKIIFSSNRAGKFALYEIQIGN